MPHINRIRVNNVKYNFGTQFYDDFVMRFSGQNTIYDLANGGGKSVLMLLLLQNLLPNCTLDEKQPIEKLFRSGNDNTTIHSLIEWKLNSCDIKNGFQYMTTGFCARKARDAGLEEEESGSSAAVEYFNYCIFYREFQGNDIVNLPLSNGNERMTFQGLRNYLRELGRKDYSVQVHIFDRKGDYQRFISDYGLYESEWEIIRGINRTEGHVRTYFETHYKTTRKVVEDLFIEEIIEKSFRNKMERGEEETEIARTLLDIKDKLVELARKKGELSHYDSQMEVLESFQTRLSGLRGIYEHKEALEEELVRTYRTAGEKQKSYARQLSETKELSGRMEERRESLNRNLENAKIVEEERVWSQLQDKVGQVRREYEKQENSCKLMEGALRERESANDYFEYLENKKQIEVQYNAISSMSGSGEELLEELQTLAYNRRHIHEERLHSIEEKREVTRQQLAQNREEMERLDREERRTENEAAVLGSRETELAKKAGQLEKQLGQLREQNGLFLLEDAPERLEQTRRGREELKEEGERLLTGLRETGEQLQRLKWDKEQSADRTALAQQEHIRAREAVERWDESAGRIGQMEEIYEEKGAEALLHRVLEAYRSAGARENQLRIRLGHRRECLDWADGGMPVVISEVQRQVLGYIQRHYDEQALLGCDYLAGCETGKQKELLEQVPYLPYAVLVHDNLVDISVDKRLAGMELEGRIIPFISCEVLENAPQKLQLRDTCLIVEDQTVIYDKQKLEETLKHIRAQIEEDEQSLKRCEEQEEILAQDAAFLNMYLENEEAARDCREEYQKALEQLRTLHEQEEADAEKEKQLSERHEKLTGLCRENEQKQQQMAQCQQQLEEMVRLYEAFLALDKELSQCRGDKENALKQMESQLHRVAELRRACGGQEEVLRNMDEALRQEEESWRSYAVYDKEGSYPLLELEPEELESLFAGKKLAYEQKNADVSDKRQLIATYEKAVERSLAAIRYQGMSLELLETMHSEHKLSRTPIEQLMQEKSVLEREQELLANMAKELADCQTRLDREEGGMRHAKRSYEEKFGAYEPLEMEPERLTLFVKEMKEQLLQLKNEESSLAEKQKELEKLCYACDSMLEEMEHMLESFEVSVDDYEGTLPEGVELRDSYKHIRREYERMSKEEQSRREDFEKDKAKLMETLKLLGAYDLAEEIGRSIFNPRTIGDVESHLDNIGRTMDCILLEKERIGKGIENMEIIKDNFENRCLQTCSTIRESLERLPKLSAIRLDDKQVHMITLQIPYVKEEFYKERMSRYIDEIVEQADTFETAAQRLQYIRGKLAWKRLFSVIVKDMDRMKLQLYKRERMKEQSRYLKYEEAVGSTGQSQGIYIQFLVAVINYIASMNARNADSTILGKVIFLDNPFGAAKDVYIWEPIFKLLESNHVQLIVPARGATPAITGRFAVNYILGQKLVGGRQQTVVVDYRSEINSAALEYRELEFEQGRLDLEDE